MDGVTFQIVGIKETVAKLAKAASLKGAMIRGLKNATARVLGRAQDEVYAGQSAGHLNIGVGYLKQNITMEVDDAQLMGYVGVRRNVPYARIHEYGGTIKPVRAPALMFQIDGHWVRTQSVTIPPRPYLHPALEEEQDGIRSDIREALEDALQ
jgi:phage gpG-like protein